MSPEGQLCLKRVKETDVQSELKEIHNKYHGFSRRCVNRTVSRHGHLDKRPFKKQSRVLKSIHGI